MTTAHKIGRPRGSTLEPKLKRAIKRDLANGHAVNAIATKRGVSHDAVRVIRDGHLVRKVKP